MFLLSFFFLQQTNEQQAGYISFKNFAKSKSHRTVSLHHLFLKDEPLN